MKIGYETKEFNLWLKSKFGWVDFEVKRLMFKAWCGRASLDKEDLNENISKRNKEVNNGKR